jgi:hypothetical protein
MLRFSTAALLIAATLACSGLRQTLHSEAGYKAKELTEEEIRSQPYDAPVAPAVDPSTVPWPSGDAPPDEPPQPVGIDAAKLDAVLAAIGE